MVADLVRAYIFQSDDAQDDITGSDKRMMKYLSCEPRFFGEIFDRFPKRDSLDTEEVISILDDEDDLPDRTNMKYLDYGHTFVGEIYGGCPECFSSDTEDIAVKKNQ